MIFNISIDFETTCQLGKTSLSAPFGFVRPSLFQIASPYWLACWLAGSLRGWLRATEVGVWLGGSGFQGQLLGVLSLPEAVVQNACEDALRLPLARSGLLIVVGWGRLPRRKHSCPHRGCVRCRINI